jgi:hypothetical protein
MRPAKPVTQECLAHALYKNNVARLISPAGVAERDSNPPPRTKSPRAKDAEALENGCGSVDHVPRVPVVYVSEEAPRSADAGLTDAGNAGSSATPLCPFEAMCTEVLREARRSDSPRAGILGEKLAAKVLASPAVSLAHQVLAGGPHAIVKATELAEHLLSSASPALACLAAASSGDVKA